jgi:hypothetical protein
MVYFKVIYHGFTLYIDVELVSKQSVNLASSNNLNLGKEMNTLPQQSLSTIFCMSQIDTTLWSSTIVFVASFVKLNQKILVNWPKYHLLSQLSLFKEKL